jgi:ABC-type phosphate transport system substrate-binding protein
MQIQDRSLFGLIFLLLLQAPMSAIDPAALAQTPTDPSAAVKTALGQKVRIDGSGSVAAVNKALTESFTREGGSVSFEVNGTTQGLAALEAGQVDLAAIGRPLTAAEKAKGFIAIPIKREKIAMIVGADNPYNGNMTIDQFAKLFRGEVQDWSEVGGAPGPVRFIDQPENSDTRNALQNYPTFKAAPFQNGNTTTRVADEKAESLGAALGKDGISYVIADEARSLPGTKIVTMHKTQPDDPRYPFSHPLYYVYKKGSVTPAAKALLKHAADPTGQAALGAVSVKDGLLPLQTEVAQAIAEPGTDGAAAVSPSPAVAVVPSPAVAIAPSPAVAVAPAATGQIPPWIWLPLLLGAGGLLWAVLKRPQGGATPEGGQGADGAAAPPVTATPSDTAATVSPRIEDPAVAAAAATATGESLPTAIAPPDMQAPAIDSAALGAGAIAGGAILGSALGNSPTSEPTAFAPVTQLPAQDQPPAATADISSSPESAVAKTTAPESTINETTVESPAGASPGATVASAAAAQSDLDAAPRSSGLDPGAVAAATVGTLGAAAMAHSYFVENPNVDDSPRSAEPTALSPATPVNPIAANLAATTVIENSVDNAVTDAPSNPALGAAISTGAVLAAKTPNLDLSGVDGDLPDLPGGYGESRIVLMARDPQWAYAYWDIPDDHKQALRDQGGQQLALRLYDVTDLDLSQGRPHSVQQYGLEEMTRDWYLPIPVSDRDYRAEIGYTTATGNWLVLAQSNAVRIPPVYPSDEIVDQFVTIPWEEPIEGKTIPLPGKAGLGPIPIHQQMFDMGMPGTAESRIAGSIGGDSSFVFPSGIGFESNLLGEQPFGAWTASGSGLGLGLGETLAGAGLSMSGVGLNMSGVGLNMSGVGFGSFQPPTNKPRNFWLVADAELIVYGATEPDANLTIDGEPVQLNPDGTFRIQLSFQDGQLRFPIMAVAADGEQMRNITMNFDRTTPLRRTNTKAEAQDEWPNA